MSQVLNMKRGDTAPPFTAQLLDNVTPIDLSTATTIRLLIKGHTPRTLTVANAATGTVTYDWQSTDLNAVGQYKAEVEVTWNDASVQTFPADDYVIISVYDDIA